MASVTESRIKEIMMYELDNGTTKTSKHYNISIETISRYKREYRSYFKKVPKILLLDIETTPIQVFVWGLFGNKFINHENVIKGWNCLSWAAKWLFSSEVLSDVLTPKEAIDGDDSRIMKSLWQLLEDADIIIAHNGDKFDIKRINTRFFINNITPPIPYKTIDTLKVAKSVFAFTSNRLDYLSKLITNKGKIETNFKLWVDCVRGNQESLDFMVKYNKEDVVLLEEVYVELRPWIKNHPNMSVYVEATEPICPTCGSTELNWGDFYVTMVGKYQTFRCKCGAIGRCRKTNLSKETRTNLTRPC